MNTPLTKDSIYRSSQASLANIKSMHPLGLGESEDIANAVLFLLSDVSRWVTGTNIKVDGGYSIR